MKSEKIKELEKIERSIVALEENLYSKDSKVAAQAEVQLGQAAKQLEAWAKKRKVKLHPHVETHPETTRGRRRCQTHLTNVPVGGKNMNCNLIGKQGRNCLYNCYDRDATYDPF